MTAIFDSAWYWLIAGLLLVGLEIAAPGIYLLWVGLGAILVGLFVAAVPDAPLPVQLIVLSAAMLGTILLGVRLQTRKRRGQAPGLNQGMAASIGKTATAAATFHAGAGRIAIDDTTYPARSSHPLREGDAVVIRGVDGAVFLVDKIG